MEIGSVDEEQSLSPTTGRCAPIVANAAKSRGASRAARNARCPPFE
jgi:hypothetical protein